MFSYRRKMSLRILHVFVAFIYDIFFCVLTLSFDTPYQFFVLNFKSEYACVVLTSSFWTFSLFLSKRNLTFVTNTFFVLVW